MYRRPIENPRKIMVGTLLNRTSCLQVKHQVWWWFRWIIRLHVLVVSPRVCWNIDSDRLVRWTRSCRCR